MGKLQIEKNAKKALILICVLSCFIFGTILFALDAKKDHRASFPEKSVKAANASSPKALHASTNLSRSEKKIFNDGDENRRDSIVTFAKSLIGSPYEYAKCTPDGFDCSGFIYYVYAKFNIKLSRSSYTIAEEGVDVDLSEAQKADLIFFKGTNLNDSKVGHVGIVISEKGEPIEFIHSSSNTKNNGVIITKLNSSHYKERYLKIKNVL